jgi:hypothetical protein
VKVSAWSKPGQALLFISHLKRESANTSVALDRKRLRLSAGALSAMDAITGATVSLDGNNLPLAFAGMNWRLIEVRDK